MVVGQFRARNMYTTPTCGQHRPTRVNIGIVRKCATRLHGAYRAVLGAKCYAMSFRYVCIGREDPRNHRVDRKLKQIEVPSDQQHRSRARRWYEYSVSCPGIPQLRRTV